MLCERRNSQIYSPENKNRQKFQKQNKKIEKIHTLCSCGVLWHVVDAHITQWDILTLLKGQNLHHSPHDFAALRLLLECF